jgi:hypothetical protein
MSKIFLTQGLSLAVFHQLIWQAHKQPDSDRMLAAGVKPWYGRRERGKYSSCFFHVTVIENAVTAIYQT